MTSDEREWLEADGEGGFASGTISLVRTRRYHALLLAALTPPTGRAVLVAGFDGRIERNGASIPFVTQAYAGGVRSPEPLASLERFESDPWPQWRFRLPDGSLLLQELFATHGRARVALRFRLEDQAGRALPGRLVLRPFLAARDYHVLLRSGSERESLLAPPREGAGVLRFSAPEGFPEIEMRSNARYRHAPHWYRDFFLAEEARRGFDCREDLASPGELVFDFGNGPAWWVVEAEGTPGADDAFDAIEAAERTRRARFPTPRDRAADAYLVRRGRGRTIVAGYPWFTDWGRDTFIALRGLCLTRGEHELAREILLEWADSLVDGVLPNRFVDRGEAPEYNTVDAALWFVVCVEEWLRRHTERPFETNGATVAARRRLEEAVDAILSGYARGTRHAIHLDRDGLLSAGEPGVQLTWMDAKVGELVVTPRIGKPVELQALWFNALSCGARFDPRWQRLAIRVRENFGARFWNPKRGCLFDVIDVDHVSGRLDPALRPNQLLAVGGVPEALLEGERAAQVVGVCENALWTPAGPRSLAPGEPDYAPRYSGGPRERDLAYHQGTVWPWLAGAFIEAWVRVHGSSAAARREARDRFLSPLQARLEVAGLGHLAEIADAEAPHAPGGCPFQAWSLAELIRIEREVVADPEPA